MQRNRQLRWSTSVALVCFLLAWVIVTLTLTAQFRAEPGARLPRHSGGLYQRVVSARYGRAAGAAGEALGSEGDEEDTRASDAILGIGADLDRILPAAMAEAGGAGGARGAEGAAGDGEIDTEGADSDGGGALDAPDAGAVATESDEDLRKRLYREHARTAVGNEAAERAGADAGASLADVGGGGERGAAGASARADGAEEKEDDDEEEEKEKELPAQELIVNQGESDEGMGVEEWLSAERTDLRKTIMAITTFFNPGRHQNKVDNFRAFRQHLADQGLALVTVELIFRDSEGEQGPDGNPVDYQLGPDDSDIIIQRHTTRGNTLWQKERLMNIALAQLPRECTKVVWLDSDLYFVSRNWVPRTAELLDKYAVVQPFAWMTYLPPNDDPFAYIPRLNDLPLGLGVGQIYHAAGLAMRHFQPFAFKSSFILGHPGFAWAARRSVLEAAGGFYQYSIVGGGDRVMLSAFTGHFYGISRYPPPMAHHVREWASRLTPLVGQWNISYTPGVVLHIWHGSRSNRDYIGRYRILLMNNYDPARDVRVAPNGELVWASKKETLHKQITDYFNNRKEGARNKSKTVESSEVDKEGNLLAPAPAKKDKLTHAQKAAKSFMAYRCMVPGWRTVCKVAFKEWTQCLRQTRDSWRTHQRLLARGGGGASARRSGWRGARSAPRESNGTAAVVEFVDASARAPRTERAEARLEAGAVAASGASAGAQLPLVEDAAAIAAMMAAPARPATGAGDGGVAGASSEDGGDGGLEASVDLQSDVAR